MSPHHIDPNVDYGRLSQLSDEFTHVWKRLQAFYHDAVMLPALPLGEAADRPNHHSDRRVPMEYCQWLPRSSRAMRSLS